MAFEASTDAIDETRDVITYGWPTCDIDAMRFTDTILVVKRDGSWKLTQPSRNGSGHKRFFVDMWLHFIQVDQQNVVWSRCAWSGKFGKGYEEVKGGASNGVDEFIRDNWDTFDRRGFLPQIDPRIRRVK